MKKITKLLSVFVIAGAIGTGIAGMTGCHKHTYSDEWTPAGAEGHYHMATCKHTEEHTEVEPHGTANSEGKCPDCGYQLNEPTPTPTPDPTPEEVKATGISITSSLKTIKVGADVTLTAAVTPANSTDKVKWSITDGGTHATIDESTGAITATTSGNITVTATAGEKSATIKLRVVKDADGLTYITSVEELNTFRTTAEHAAGTYRLACDIDLEGVTLDATKAVLKEGVVFDGDGYVISNALYVAAEKTGLLFESSTGGEVKDVKFLSCAINGVGNETAGMVVGLGNGGTFSQLEFNSCSVSCNNYGGFVVGRNNASNATINISEITTKNGCVVTTQQYGGILVGDMDGTATFNFKDLQLDGELKGSSGNGSFVAGRTRAGAKVKIENAVISAEIASPANNAIFSGNGACATLTIKNVLILKSNSALLAKTAPTTADYENIVTVEGVTVTGATATNGQNTVAYLTDTFGFDFTDVWMEEGESYRLKASSTNIKSPDATITRVKLNTNNAKLRFKKGEEYTAEGLVVMGAYSDGVTLVLNSENGYEIDTSKMKDEAGTYTITVKAKEDSTVVATYDVVVAEQTGFIVIDEHMAHTYLKGGKLDTDNLVVKSIWTDGIEEKLAKDEFTVDATTFDMTTVGEYNVKIKHGAFEDKIIKISVQATKPVPVDGKIYVNVDPTYDGANGAQVKGIETFKTVADAIDYLEACGLEASVQKVVYIGEGVFEGKITTALDNLVLIGKGDDKSVLTYSAVEGMVNPVNEKTWGMDCATLHINGEGFKAYNLTIRNDFNYIRDNKKYASPQGFALTINGDKAILENCHLYGNQDTLFLKNGRSYFKNTLIEGNVDFIFGENTGLAYFDHCTINAISRYDESTSNKSNNGYVTAMKGDAGNKVDYGYIFESCNFTHGTGVIAGSMSLGRPWGPAATVAMLNCTFSEAYSTHGFKTDLKDPAKPNEFYKGRWEEMSGNSPAGASFVEYNSTGDGAITEAVAGGSVIDATAAAAYTAANLFKGTNGKVKWGDGSAANDWAYATDVATLATLTGEKVAATDIYVSSTNVSVEVGKTAELLVSVNPWNALDKTLAGLTVTSGNSSIATYADGKVTGVAQGTTTLTISATGMTDVIVNITVTEASPDNILPTLNLTYSDNNVKSGVTFSADAPTAWDNDGVVKLYSTTGKQWSNDGNRLKSNGAAPYISVDLTEYTGDYIMTMVYAPGGTSTRSINVTEDGVAAAIFTKEYSVSSQQTESVTLTGGKVYKIGFASNGFNFYSIKIEAKTNA